MHKIVLVGLGGCLGAIARYKLGGWVLHHTVDWHFPLGTFVVNVLGCALMGLLAGLVERYRLMSMDVQLLVLTGGLGGFTTYSAFGFDTVYLLRRGEWAAALAYVSLTVLCGIGALAIVTAAIVRPS